MTDSRTGRVGVYSNDNKLLDAAAYHSVKRRREIIDTWLNDYAGIAAFIQVYPFPYLKRDHERTKHLIETIPVPERVKDFVRPSAIYDNGKSLYGIDYDQ